jgi:hypothetical protein
MGLATAACGDDDSASVDEPAVEADGDLAAYCEDEVAISRIFQETDADDPETFDASLEAARPVLDRIVDEAPAEVSEAVAALDAAFADVEETRNPEAFFTETAQGADEEVHAYDLAHCGWETVAVTAEDYHYTATFPTTAGTVSFEVDNAGTEPHLLLVARKLDSVEGTAMEAFEGLEAEEDLPNSFEVAATVFVEPGDTDYGVAELAAGDYVAFCPIPVGTTMDNGGEVDGPPHFTQGMVTGFTVG